MLVVNYFSLKKYYSADWRATTKRTLPKAMNKTRCQSRKYNRMLLYL